MLIEHVFMGNGVCMHVCYSVREYQDYATNYN